MEEFALVLGKVLPMDGGMPVWVIEMFGRGDINQVFWLVFAAALPFWLMMLVFPHKTWVRRICHPFFVPPLLAVLYLYIVFEVVNTVGWPKFAGVEAHQVRRVFSHPLYFLVVWSRYMAMDLFAGMVIYQEAVRRKQQVPVELFFTWLMGPLGLLFYGIRLGWAQLREKW
ncbi:MAG: DUF4281 domain-containing protein [Opitutales bacterium]|nr:DUF4281 domain-containing protein [Opitutales bacterium]